MLGVFQQLMLLLHRTFSIVFFLLGTVVDEVPDFLFSSALLLAAPLGYVICFLEINMRLNPLTMTAISQSHWIGPFWLLFLLCLTHGIL